MESEKVKEIKKVLEQNTKTCLLYDFEKNTECKVFHEHTVHNIDV